MYNFLLIFICLLAGVFLARTGLVPTGTHKGINIWVLYVALPTLTLRYVPEIQWGWHLLLPVISPALIWFGSWLFVRIYCRLRNLDNGTRIALTVTCGLGNTSFLGFPLISAYYGESFIKDAVIFDQVTFIIFSTLGVITVIKGAGEKNISPLGMLKKIFSFPTFIGLLLALILPRFIDISPLNPLFDKLIATLSPMSLFSIGLQLHFAEWRKQASHLAAGLSYKLIFAPAMIYMIALLMNSPGDFMHVSVIEAATPAMITASLLAAQYNHNPQLCNLMATLGIITGIGTSALWWMFMP